MKAAGFIAVCAAALTLTACSSGIGQHNAKKDKDYNYAIRLMPEDESLLTECTEVTEHRLMAEYPMLECNVMYKRRDSFSIIEFDLPQEWDKSTLEALCRKGSLTFRKGSDTETDSDGQTIPTGEIILDNSDIDTACATLINTESGQEFVVSVTLCDKGTEAFAIATEELAGTGTPLSIWLDNELISSPTVTNAIINGHTNIEGNFTKESATELAAAISSLALPCGLEITEYRS